MNLRGALRVLERGQYLVRNRRIPPILALAWLESTDDLSAHSAAMSLLIRAAGGSLVAWWGEKGRECGELVALFAEAITAAQIQLLEEM